MDYLSLKDGLARYVRRGLSREARVLAKASKETIEHLLKQNKLQEDRIKELESKSLQQIGWLVNVTYLHGNSTVIQLCRDYYDLGAENCPLDNEGNWKSDHPNHYMSKLTLSSSIVHRVKIQKVFAENELKSEVENEQKN
jgi:hypothetical protein